MGKGIDGRLSSLEYSAGVRRDDLFRSGNERMRKRRLLNFIAGVLAISSAGATGTAIANQLGNGVMQILAAAGASLAGTISLFLASYFSESEIADRLFGSSKYLGLRQRIQRLDSMPHISDEQKHAQLTRFEEEYRELDERYLKYFSHEPHFASQPMYDAARLATPTNRSDRPAAG